MTKKEPEEKKKLVKKKKLTKKTVQSKTPDSEEVVFTHKELPIDGDQGELEPHEVSTDVSDHDHGEEETEAEAEGDPEPEEVSLSMSHVLADPKESKKRMEEQLEALYQNEDGKMPDLNTFEKQKHSSFLRALSIFFFSLFLLLVVVSAGLFYFRPGVAFEEKNVVISATGKQEVAVGELLTYHIDYQNNTNTELADATLRVRYPEGFVFQSSSRESNNETRDEWVLDTLSPGESGSIEISGSFYANFGSEQSFRIFLDYLPANFSSSFQAVAVTDIHVAQSPYEIVLDMPSEVIEGSKMSVRVRVSSLTVPTSTSSTVFLRLNPGNFLFQEARPAADEGTPLRWALSEKALPFELELIGSFSLAEDGTSAPLLAEVVMTHPVQTNKEVVVTMNTREPKILTSEVVLDRVINGSTGDLSVQPGDTLNTSLVLKNTNGSSVENVQLRAIFVAPAFNDRSILAWDKIADELDGTIAGEKVNALLRRGIITWDNRQSAALKKIESGKEVTIDFSLPIRSGADLELGNFTTSTAEFVVEARYTLGGETKVMSSLPIKITLNSDLRFETRHEEEQTGNKATHEVAWILENSFHDLQDVTVTADVYGDVVVSKDDMVIPAGEVSYDEEKKKIVWKVDQMPTSVDVLPFKFVIKQNSLNPSQTELMSKVEIRATDTVTGRQIVLVGSAITLGASQ